MLTYVDVSVRVLVQHDNDQDPEDVIAECDYDFTIEPDDGKATPKIVETEITEADTVGEADPETHALLPAE